MGILLYTPADESLVNSGEVLPGVATTLYRFVRSLRIHVDDFKSQGALGRQMKRPGNQRAWDDGISVWDTYESAYRRAQELGFAPGSFIVEIVLPDDHGLEIEGPTGHRGHHYTIYNAEPRFLMSCAGTPIKMAGAP